MIVNYSTSPECIVSFMKTNHHVNHQKHQEKDVDYLVASPKLQLNLKECRSKSNAQRNLHLDHVKNYKIN